MTDLPETAVTAAAEAIHAKICDPHAGHESDDVNGFPHPRICLTCSGEDGENEVEYFRREPDDDMDRAVAVAALEAAAPLLEPRIQTAHSWTPETRSAYAAGAAAERERLTAKLDATAAWMGDSPVRLLIQSIADDCQAQIAHDAARAGFAAGRAAERECLLNAPLTRIEPDPDQPGYNRGVWDIDATIAQAVAAERERIGRLAIEEAGKDQKTGWDRIALRAFGHRLLEPRHDNT